MAADPQHIPDDAAANPSAMPPVGNARMYSATAGLKADWKQLLGWALARAGLDWPLIDHDAPAPLDALWSRGDLGLAMMCGLPFAAREPRPTLIAAPVPSPARYGGRPVYFTDVVVRADAPYRTLPDTFGGVVGYTLAGSMSGGVAFRHHLAPYARARREQGGGRLYRAAVGDLIHARGVIEALDRGDIDVGPLDAYYHDLLKRNDAAFAARVRTLATTVPTPIPPLVATRPLPDGVTDRLREALRAAVRAPEHADLTDRLQLADFAVPDPRDYALLLRIAADPVPPFEEI